MNSTLMQQQLQLPYSRATWRPVLRELLPGLELFAQDAVSPLANEREREIATARRQFGRATLTDGKIIALYEIDVVPAGVDLIRNRVALRQLITRCIDQATAHAVLAFFLQPGVAIYRLTYTARESTIDLETLAVLTHETAARRYTYILGPGETRRTAASRLANLGEKRATATLAEVTDAFSVERLNNEFFTRYKEHYTAFCQHLLANEALLAVFHLDLADKTDKELDRARKPVRDFVKKLLGRLVFLHFLQKKGWLGCPALPPAQAAMPQEAVPWVEGQGDFIRRLFDSASPSERNYFHSARLVPLFFDTLNDSHRAGHLFGVTGTRVPYLNGGLFERDFVGVDALDFPAVLFRDLLDFFSQFHFTIDENDPEEQEIGIDPEMLGHIFENLLEDNKDKGAYYTPKAVVQYMAQQSLIHALAGRFPNDPVARDEIEKLIRFKEPVDSRNSQSWLATWATQVASYLNELKICDPAIGSGAFPIGLLQEIYWTQLTLNPALDRASAKRLIIQHSIHGVDLDAGAVEIARLRFWLALIVDEHVPRPLPNLDYQIMQGNSLLESFEGEHLDTLDQPRRYGVQRLGSNAFELPLAGAGADSGEMIVTVHTPAQHDLAELQRRYFLCHEPVAKADLRAEIDAAVLRAIDTRLALRREELEASLRSRAVFVGRTHQRGGDKQRAAMRAELDALSGKSASLHAMLANPRAERPFFLWHFWFREIFERNGGFDIVIANPPYVRQESIKDFKPALKTEPYECFDGLADLLVYFYECAVKKLRPGGVLTFITSNKFYRAGYGEALRGFLARELTLHRLIDFGDAPVFDAIAYASILEGTRATASLDSGVRIYTWEKGMSLDHIEPIVAARGGSIQQSELTPQGWRLESPAVLNLLAKLRVGGVPLGEYVKGRFYYGIKTGMNDAFVVDRATRDRLIAEHVTSAELLKPFLRGKDVKRWAVKFADRYLIKIVSSANAKHPWSGCETGEAERIFAETYPAVHRWLSGFRDGLIARDDQGTYFWELRSCAYWQEFEQPKILYPDIYEHQSFVWDESNYFAANTCYFIPASGKWLTALLNSSAVEWFYAAVSNKVRGGYLRAFSDYMKQIPIPAASSADQTALAALVDGIPAAKLVGQMDTVTRLETEIDTHIFRLYGLTLDEIALIQNRAS